jgi:feruloyl esterase
MSKTTARIGAGLLINALVAHGASAQSSPFEVRQERCATARVSAMVSAPVQIESVDHVPATQDVPAHCAIVGFIEHGSRIGFSAALPDDWNKKFLFFGIGGFAGVLEPLQRGIARGYATGTTDTGHKGSSLEDASWALNNPAAVLNHFETSVDVTARTLKALTAAYYGATPTRAYFEGCSAGGRQGVIEAQRFPGTFDGIVAAAPAWNYTKLLTSFIENGKRILQSRDNWVPPALFAQIDRVVMSQCDASDGLRDQIVTDPRRCKPDLRELACKTGSESQTCLTPAQLRTIESLVAPEFAKQEHGYFGFPLTGSERTAGYSWGWSEWFFGTMPPRPDASGAMNFVPNSWPRDPKQGLGPNQFVLGEQFFRYIVMGDPKFDARSFQFDRGGEKLQRDLGRLLDADDTDLGPFVRAGGKLLLWHGWSDPAIPAEMAIDLLTRIQRDTRQRPGQMPTDEAVRLFMAPGVQHCGGGFGLTSFDALGALEQWLEHGIAPDRIVATQLRDDKPVRSRPLCAYPKAARYRGTGNPDDAASFDCK